MDLDNSALCHTDQCGYGRGGNTNSPTLLSLQLDRNMALYFLRGLKKLITMDFKLHLTSKAKNFNGVHKSALETVCVSTHAGCVPKWFCFHATWVFPHTGFWHQAGSAGHQSAFVFLADTAALCFSTH